MTKLFKNMRVPELFMSDRKSNFHDLEYLNLVNRVLTQGESKKGRNSKVISKFGEKMEFPLNTYKIPILTTKKMAWKTCVRELLWFINGSTDNSVLEAQGVKIWNANASEDFKKSIGIQYDNKNDLGPVYGHQWRYFNAEYTGCDTDYAGKGVDQLANLIDKLQNADERHSRRLIMSAWNPCQLEKMVLPPCHVLSHFSVNESNELSCAIYQRSGDIGLGIPFNIASYSFLTFLLARHCGLKPGKFVHFIGDAHIYDNHIPQLKHQLSNKIHESPSIEIRKHNNIDDYSIEDFSIFDYVHCPKIEMEMIA
tara:strand:- start:513 stop:1442 length:930 start_codon:yes stop_codon:yes gene_type:complete